MRILIAPYDGISKNDTSKWNVDEIILRQEINLYSFPKNENELLYFIPTIFNADTALEYEGVELALKLYTTALREKFYNIKIVLVGIESCESFMLNYSYPNILKCPGISYILLMKDSISIYANPVQSINPDLAISALTNLGMRLPKSYVANHSFTNEWCAYAWSKYMGFSCKGLSEALESTIYFNYLRTLLSNEKEGRISETKIAEIAKLKGRILLIDDNIYWHNFFKNFFTKTNSSVIFSSVGADFRHKSIKEIIGICSEKVEEFKPDIILLDFRLLEDTDYSTTRTKISGVQVLRELKGTPDKAGIAYGTKIIMFTATEKIEHVLALQKFGADSFLLKQSPEQYANKPSVKESINELIMQLKDMYRCACVSKIVCNSLNDCIELSKSYHLDIQDEIKHSAEAVQTLLQGNFYQFSRLKLLYLDYINILEVFKRFYNPQDNLKPFVENHASNLTEWNNIANIRNALAHGLQSTDINRIHQEVTEDLIAKYLKILSEFTVDFIRNFSPK